ncbi:MAG: catechol 2,3-dioxygenase-like lactoylglutathione lyase family enzyme, partial [Cellvibrionaceae bacterium]
MAKIIHAMIRVLDLEISKTFYHKTFELVPDYEL